MLKYTAVVIAFAGLAVSAQAAPQNTSCKPSDVNAGAIASHFLCNGQWYGLQRAFPVTAQGFGARPGEQVAGYIANTDQFTIVTEAYLGNRSISLSVDPTTGVPCNAFVCGTTSVPLAYAISFDSAGAP